jgi:hypothetical protein
MAVGIRYADYVAPLYPQKFGTNFADKWRSVTRYSSLVDLDQKNFFGENLKCKVFQIHETN